ncbi:MAG: hypothetical protein JXA24_04460 [Proteobacteria bacterium]|nr:hypothetical protein [Pseudomonadota bacterium]
MKGESRIIGPLVAVALLCLAGEAMAWECVPGNYQGKTWSVTKELNGLDATLTVSRDKGMCRMKFTTQDGSMNEVWDMGDNRIRQLEYRSDGKKAREYGATLEVRDGVEGYYIDCAEKGCDAGADSRYFWRIQTPGKKIIYSVWGVAPEKQSDPAEKAKKRHEYTFTPVKQPPVTSH